MKNLENSQAAVVTIWSTSLPDITLCSAETAISITACAPGDDRSVCVKQVDMATAAGYPFVAFRVERKYTDGDTLKVSLLCVFPPLASADIRREILITLIRNINHEWPASEKKEAEGE